MFFYFFNFQPRSMGKWSKLTNIFSSGLKPPTSSLNPETIQAHLLRMVLDPKYYAGGMWLEPLDKCLRLYDWIPPGKRAQPTPTKSSFFFAQKQQILLSFQVQRALDLARDVGDKATMSSGPQAEDGSQALPTEQASNVGGWSYPRNIFIVSNILYFSPRTLEKWSNLMSIFFKWVGSTTN